MIVDTYPTRAAWLAARNGPTTLGASEVAAALGVHPHLDPWGLWENKRRLAQAGPTAPSHDTNVLQRGHRWESAVLAEYEDASGAKVVLPGHHVGRPGHLVTLSDPARPWLRESPDAFAIDPRTGALGHVEAKTAMHRDGWSPEPGVVIERWEDGAEELVPPHYAVQAYIQLAITGLPWNDLCALVPYGGWLAARWVRLMADADTQGALLDAVTEWRERHLIAGEPPPVDGSRACNRFLAGRFSSRPARVASPEEAAMLRELATLRAAAKANEARVAELVNTLTAAAEGSRLLLSAEKGAPYGQPQASAGRTSVDLAQLAKDFPEAHAACRRTGAPFVSFATYRFKE